MPTKKRRSKANVPSASALVSPAPDVDITLMNDHSISLDGSRAKRELRLQFETTVGIDPRHKQELEEALLEMIKFPTPDNKRAVFEFLDTHAGMNIPEGSAARAVIKAALGVE